MIEVRDFALRRGAFSIDGLSLKVDAGECLAIVGPSGAGKTMLVESILGIHLPAGGQVLIDGQEVTRLPPEQRGFGYVPQDLALFPHLGVRDNIAFARQHRVPQEEVARAVREVAGWLGIEHLLDRRSVAQLSGGEKQRVALARAIVAAPRALFLDEPFNSLDLALRADLYRQFGDLRRRMGLTTVLVTHDHDEAFALGDRMAVLLDGRILQLGTPEEIYRRPASVEVARLLLVENLLTARRIGPGSAPGRAVYRVLGAEIEGPARAAAAAGDAVWLGIRARHVRVRAGAGAAACEAGARNAVGAKVVRRMPRSGHEVLEVAPVADPSQCIQVILSDQQDDGPHETGALLTVELPLQHLLLLEERAGGRAPKPREQP
jgi:molybdate/tungstate transport system ATP-binding protein